MCFELFRALDEEWNDLVRSARARTRLDHWRDDPTLRPFEDLSAIVHALRNGGSDPAAANQILAALAIRAADDDLAARTMLQALIPGLVNVAKRLASPNLCEDLEAQVLTEAVDRIRNYPLDRRPRAIAANITWDVFGRIARRGRATEIAVAELTGEAEVPIDPSDEVHGLLTEALETGKLRQADAQLLAAISIGHDTIATRARTEGTTYKAMNERWRRARNRFRDALAA